MIVRGHGNDLPSQVEDWTYSVADSSIVQPADGVCGTAENVGVLLDHELAGASHNELAHRLPWRDVCECGSSLGDRLQSSDCLTNCFHYDGVCSDGKGDDGDYSRCLRLGYLEKYRQLQSRLVLRTSDLFGTYLCLGLDHIQR